MCDTSDTSPIPVSQNYIALLQLMSDQDTPFTRPANGYSFGDDDTAKTIKANTKWLKDALLKLGKPRIVEHVQTTATNAFKGKWFHLSGTDWCPKSQKEADCIKFKGAAQRMWLAADKAMETSGDPMYNAWKTVYVAMKMPNHLDGEVENPEVGEEDSDGTQGGDGAGGASNSMDNQ